MEGDAGASRLNSTDAADQASTEVTAEDSPESEVGADQASTEVTAEEDSSAQTAPEPGDVADTELTVEQRNPSRMGRRWLIGVTAGLVVLAAGVAAGGYFVPVRYHRESQAIERNNAAALAAAKDCVAATNAPDTAAMAASQQKIIECSTGDFGAQAPLYASLLADAYQAVDARVQVTDMRAAVERNNNDGSVDVLVACRVKISNNAEQDRELGYRLRATMTAVDGQYKIFKLDQVTK